MANECERVITLGYIQDFIAGTPLAPSYSGNGKPDSYCPTYEELTGGTYLPVRNSGSTPKDDIDGLMVNSNYSDKQLVRREDFSIGYTFFESFTITASTTTVSECGDNVTFSSTVNFKRWTKSQGSDCELTSTTSASTSVTDGSIAIRYNLAPSDAGSFSSNVLTVNKNGSVSSNSRTLNVYGEIVFRGNTISSNTVSIVQSALTGSYSVFVSSSITSYDTFSITGTKSFDCDGGTTTSAGTYTITSTYKWKDSCGTEYPSVTSAMTTSKTESGSIIVGARSPYDSTCTPATGTTVIVNWHGKTDTYTQTCACVSCNCDSLTISVKASQNAPTAIGATTTYNTTATATASGGGGQGSLEWSNGNTQTSVGSKTTKARWSGNSNYDASLWSNEVTLTMNKASQNAPTATGATVEYGQTATATASGGGGQGSLEWSNGNTLSTLGSKTTKARWSGNSNYDASPWSNEVTLTVEDDDYSKHYFTMVVTSGGNIIWTGRTTANTLSYSKDNGTTWTTANSSITISVTAGDKVLWKGTQTPNSSGIGYFSGDTNARYSVEGNAMSLLYGDNFKGQTSLEGKSNAFSLLFSSNSNVTSAENLSLPATTLGYYCYDNMFRDCTSLTTAPSVLPATNLSGANFCYSSMFEGCTSLTTAPELPATMLVEACYYRMFYNCTNLTTVPSVLPATTAKSGCYESMFYNCTNLTTAPELPATNLSGAYGCYQDMFYNCRSLTTAPELPATTLVQSCYENMFRNCISLNSIKCLATNISATKCTKNWVYGVAESGTFTKAESMGSWTTGDNGIPSDWTVVNA